MSKWFRVFLADNWNKLSFYSDSRIRDITKEIIERKNSIVEVFSLAEYETEMNGFQKGTIYYPLSWRWRTEDPTLTLTLRVDHLAVFQ